MRVLAFLHEKHVATLSTMFENLIGENEIQIEPVNGGGAAEFLSKVSLELQQDVSLLNETVSTMKGIVPPSLGLVIDVAHVGVAHATVLALHAVERLRCPTLLVCPGEEFCVEQICTVLPVPALNYLVCHRSSCQNQESDTSDETHARLSRPRTHIQRPHDIHYGFLHVTPHSFNACDATIGRELGAVLRYFLTWFPRTGRLISFEGGDGAGKETQAALMVSALHSHLDRTSSLHSQPDQHDLVVCRGRSFDSRPACAGAVYTMDFPHDTAEMGALIRHILSGQLGSIRDVHPLLFASLYAMNRYHVAALLRYWLCRGSFLVLDRYVEANFGHQCAKVNDDAERHSIIRKLQTFEHDWLGLPSSHLILFLDLPPNVAMGAMQHGRGLEQLDMHEKAGIEYKNQVRETYLWCAHHTKNSTWRVVENMCPGTDTQNQACRRKTREEVHDECWKHVQDVVLQHLNIEAGRT